MYIYIGQWWRGVSRPSILTTYYTYNLVFLLSYYILTYKPAGRKIVRPLYISMCIYTYIYIYIYKYIIHTYIHTNN